MVCSILYTSLLLEQHYNNAKNILFLYEQVTKTYLF